MLSFWSADNFFPALLVANLAFVVPPAAVFSYHFFEKSFLAYRTCARR